MEKMYYYLTVEKLDQREKKGTGMYEAFHGGAGSCPIDISRHQCPGRAGGQRTDLKPREDSKQKVMNQPSHICSTPCFNSTHLPTPQSQHSMPHSMWNYSLHPKRKECLPHLPSKVLFFSFLPFFLPTP